jgi:hypothetical protein
VRNIQAHSEVRVQVGDRTYRARGRVVAEAAEDSRARDLVYEKYASSYGGDLTGWRGSALPVALDLSGPGVS